MNFKRVGAWFFGLGGMVIIIAEMIKPGVVNTNVTISELFGFIAMLFCIDLFNLARLNDLEKEVEKDDN